MHFASILGLSALSGHRRRCQKAKFLSVVHKLFTGVLRFPGRSGVSVIFRFQHAKEISRFAGNYISREERISH